MIYGYIRISTPKQNIERQRRNILAKYPDARIYEEAYTGTTQERPEWQKLIKRVNTGDTIVFDSVSRMSRTAQAGFDDYMMLFDKGIELRFIKQPYINSDVYKHQMDTELPETGTNADIIIKAVQEYIKVIAKQQIMMAFEQSELEVSQLRQRTKEGLVTAKKQGKKVGRPKGIQVVTEKEKKCKKAIKELSKTFNGSLTDKDVLDLLKISPTTYYKYKREMKKNDEAIRQGNVKKGKRQG